MEREIFLRSIFFVLIKKLYVFNMNFVPRFIDSRIYLFKFYSSSRDFRCFGMF